MPAPLSLAAGLAASAARGGSASSCYCTPVAAPRKLSASLGWPELNRKHRALFITTRRLRHEQALSLAAGGPRRTPGGVIDPHHQPVSRPPTARTHRRCHGRGRRSGRIGAQRLSNRPQGRMDGQAPRDRPDQPGSYGAMTSRIQGASSSRVLGSNRTCGATRALKATPEP